MKRIIITLAITSLVFIPLFSQNVTIPDTAFLAALIEEGVDTNADGQISYAEAEAVTNLDVNRKSISDLTGIEAFVNLESLNCFINQLTSLDVSNNTALTYLDCYSNQLTSLNLSENTSLQSLDCWNNPLKSLDLSKNTVLTELNCTRIEITSLDVSNNTLLEYLDCRENQLTSLDVSNNTALTSLLCYGNQLTSLDVGNNTLLEYLECRSNQLTSLDLSNNTALEKLHSYDNQLTSLDVSGCNALKVLDCYGNQLTSLDVSGCNALTELYCLDNQLTGLDVSNNSSIRRLRCSGNELTSLDLSNNRSLESLDCGETMGLPGHGISANPLISINISNCPELASLNCEGCKLTSLDISNNIALSYLDLSNMPTLEQVCVWELPFPPEDDNYNSFDTTGSPNICFDTICDGECGNVPVFEKFTGQEFSIYPNPTNSILTIEADNPDCYSLEIHSLNGQLIYKEEMEGNSMQIDLTPFSKGFYFITVRSDAWVRTEKVVKY